ncbi:beta sliding clamp [Gammaproteobacteria bacterium]
MRFTIQREALLKPLQAVASVVERRQTLPVLGNLLLAVTENELAVTATDLEVELVGRIPLMAAEPGRITVPARKLLDICRALPEGTEVGVTLEGERVWLRAGRSRYTLATLPAEEFPNVEEMKEGMRFSLPQNVLKGLIARTHFAMAVADVRYFLIGLLLEVEKGWIRACATDGHRLALSEIASEVDPPNPTQVIIPRKGVGELLRLLQDSQVPVEVMLGTNHIQITLPDTTFTSKLIDGRFPDYQRVIPQTTTKVATTARENLRQALNRAAIISNEKFRGVRLHVSEDKIRVLAANPEQEEAEEELAAEYQGEPLEIGFNVGYLLDALGAIEDEQVMIGLTNADSSALIHGVGNVASRYVVMPMRL